MTIDEIKELIQVFNESGVAEMEVQRGENRLKLRRASIQQEYVVAPAPQILSMPSAPAAPAVPAQPAIPPALTATATAKAPEPDSGHVLVKSPIVGTYYDAPAPERSAVRQGRRRGRTRPGPVHHRIDEADERD